MTTIAKVENANVSYGNLQAVFGVTLTVEEGECLAIVGANGAGKSTLLKFLAGAAAGQASGTFFFAGQPVPPTVFERARLGIGWIPEGRRLFQSLTVRENLEIGAETARSGPWTLERVCALFPDLETLLDRGALELSGGQQQMVAIGRTLMGNPRLLLCDEISLGLAPKAIASMYRAIDEIRKTGTSMILVEQDLTQAMRAADRLACIRQGQILLEGTPDELSRTDISSVYFGTGSTA